MDNIYRILANCVFWIHVFWVILMLSLAILSPVYPFLSPISLTVVITTLMSQVLWKGCPLIYLENTLIRKYDPSHKQFGSFIGKFYKNTFNIEIPAYVIFIQLIVLFLSVLWLNLWYFSQ